MAKKVPATLPSNGPRRSSHVCFKCRTSYRHSPARFSWTPKHDIPNTRVCAKCRGRCIAISHKLEVPKVADDRGWESLRSLVYGWIRSERAKMTLLRDAATRPLSEELKKLRKLKRPTRAHAVRIELLEKQLAKLEQKFRPRF